MTDHRSPNFPQLVKPLFEDLKKVFKTTSGQTFIFPATGAAGWEIALANTLSPGDRVLIYRFGQFSHLWMDLARGQCIRPPLPARGRSPQRDSRLGPEVVRQRALVVF